MEQFRKDCIGLIGAAFTENAYVLSADFDWEKAAKVAKNHNIASILFYGALNSHVSQDGAAMQELQRLAFHNLMVSTQQMHEIEQIAAAFEQENIEYMPLKGTILKGLYPKPEMRTMGDADILIRLAQYPAIETIMTNLGFVFDGETDHELVWQKPSLFLELHKAVMTSYNKDFYGYFGDGWGIAKSMDGCCRYEMSTEDFYLYIFVHFTKHYRISGIGIKHLLDLWVYRNAHPELNDDYVTRELGKMGLAQFHQHVLDTIDVWFNGAESTDITDLITNVIFKSGQYGSKEQALVNRALQNGQRSATKIKFQKTFGVAFAPYRVMKEKYPVLTKAPFLLPIMWVVRGFDVLFRRQSTLKRYMDKVAQVDNEQMDENKRALDAVGLTLEYNE